MTARLMMGKPATVLCTINDAQIRGVSARCGRAGNDGREIRSQAERRR